MNVLLGLTGSVAAMKAEKVYAALAKLGPVKAVATEAGVKLLERAAEQRRFDGPVGCLSKVEPLGEEDEWQWQKVGDPVLHVELARWADVLVIAPCTACTLAKMAQGVADNLLVCVYLAMRRKPVVVAPAMNTEMWLHPAVQENVWELLHRHSSPDKRPGTGPMLIVPPVEKKLACGDVGIGALEDAGRIAELTEAFLKGRPTG